MAENNQQGKDLQARALALLQNGNYAEAERLCFLLLKADQKDFQVWFYLGAAQQFQSKLHEALASFKKAAALEPESINVLNAMASCHEQLGRMEDAHNNLRRAYDLQRQNTDVQANLAVILAKLGRPQEALEYYDMVLQKDSTNRIALVNRGALLARLGRRQQGLDHYRHAHLAYPEDLEILYNLVDAMIGMFAYEEALTYCDMGLARNPIHAYLMFKKGMVLSCLRRFPEARECISKAQILQPWVLRDLLTYLRDSAYPSAHVDPGTLYFEAMYEEQKRCFWHNRLEYIQELERSIAGSQTGQQIPRHREFGFAIFSLNLNAQIRLSLMRSISEYVQDEAWRQEVPPFIHGRQDRKRLRIGYVSPDFRKHPVGLLTKNLYALHNREDFEVAGYSLLNPGDDSIFRYIKESCDLFRDISRLDSKDIARQIYEDDIDILIDLAGYTTFSRSEIFAYRPAPLQISYLGYMGTMGADFMDYAMLDHTLCPVEKHIDWHEAPIKLPRSHLVYDTELLNAPFGVSRSEHYLPENAIVFCCLNTSYKIEPGIFCVWMRILKRVEHSVLWLAPSDPHTIANLKAEAAQAGVPAERLIFAGMLPVDQHLLRYQLADLFLDTFWHNAHTTAADALWQGLPVLTCMGEASSSRIAASLLTALEVPELITHNMQEYEEKAVYYATHPEALNALKRKVRSKRDTAPLFDISRTVRALERGYKLAWQRYQDGLPPAAIEVPDEITGGALREPV